MFQRTRTSKFNNLTIDTDNPNTKEPNEDWEVVTPVTPESTQLEAKTTESIAIQVTTEVMQQEVQHTEPTITLATESMQQEVQSTEPIITLATESMQQEVQSTEPIITLATESMQQEVQSTEPIITLATESMQQEVQSTEPIITLATESMQQEVQSTEPIITLATESMQQEHQLAAQSEIKEYSYTITECQPIPDITIIDPTITENTFSQSNIYSDISPPNNLVSNEKITQEKLLACLEELEKISLQLKQKEEIITQLHQDKEKANKELFLSHKEIENISEELLQVRKDKEKTDKELFKERNIVLASAKKIVSYHNKIQAIKIEKSHLEKTIQNHPMIENTLRKETSYVINFLEKKDLEITELKAENDNLKNLNTAIKQQAHADQKTIQVLKKTIQLTEESLTQTRADKDSAEHALEEKTALLQSANAELEQVKSRFKLTTQIFQAANEFDQIISLNNKINKNKQKEELEKLSQKMTHLGLQNEILIRERDVAQLDFAILKEQTRQSSDEKKKILVEKKENPLSDLYEEREHIQKTRESEKIKPSYSDVAAGKKATKLDKISLFKTTPPSYPRHQKTSQKQEKRTCFSFLT